MKGIGHVFLSGCAFTFIVYRVLQPPAVNMCPRDTFFFFKAASGLRRWLRGEVPVM